MILEPKKIKCVTVSIVSPSICHEMMGTLQPRSSALQADSLPSEPPEKPRQGANILPAGVSCIPAWVGVGGTALASQPGRSEERR